MSEIKFKGQRVDTKEWVYGYYHQVTKGAFLDPIQNASVITTYKVLDNGEIILTGAYNVIPETVGQYTGLKDKNGIEIYEGDIVSLSGNTDLWSTLCGVVEFRHGSFINAYNWKGNSKKDERFDYLIDVVRNGYEVIGNIHDNRELLEVQNETE